MTILSFGKKKTFFVFENSISFKDARYVSKKIISDLETGRLTVLTPCSKMREQVKLRAPSINTEKMIQKIIRKFPLKSIEHFIEKVICIKKRKQGLSRNWILPSTPSPWICLKSRLSALKLSTNMTTKLVLRFSGTENLTYSRYCCSSIDRSMIMSSSNESFSFHYHWSVC